MKTLTIKLGFNELNHKAVMSGDFDTSIVLKGIEKGILDFCRNYPSMPEDAVLNPVDET